MDMSIPVENCEPIRIPQGVIYLGPSSTKRSVGYLRLLPNQQLDRHNRPVDEKLSQVKGSCVMELYDGEELSEEKKLNEGDELLIPANQYHKHTNPFDKESVTFWQFDGDITEIVENIRGSVE